MSEIEEMGQAGGRVGAAMLSVALVAARIAMQQRAERAEQARREDELAQREAARELHAVREQAAVGWSKVNLTQWFRESPGEVSKIWASAATWSQHDARAREAFESLNMHLDRLGTHNPTVAQAMHEQKDFEGLARLLKHGADEAYGRLRTQLPTPEHATTGASAEQVADWAKLNPLGQFDSPEQVAEAWADAATWAAYDPRAAEALGAINDALTRDGVTLPAPPDGPALPDFSQAVDQLLEQGRELAAHESGTPERGGGWVAFEAYYREAPEAALQHLRDSYLQPISEASPHYYAALEHAAGRHDLATWFAENLDHAYQLNLDYPDPAPDTTHASAGAGAEAGDRPGAEQTGHQEAVEAPASLPPTQIYADGQDAARLAGMGFATTTRDAIHLGGASKYRAVSVSMENSSMRARRRGAQQIKGHDQEHGRG